MTDATTPPLPNSPDARTPDGTLKDPTVTPPVQTDSSTTPPQKTETDGSAPPTKTESTRQPTDGKSALTDTGKAPAGAPETYADFKAPDGYEIDKASLDKAIPLFKELNLNQEQAQKAIDLYTDLAKAAADEPVNFYANMQKDWRKEAEGRFGADIAPGGKIVTEFSTAIDGFLPPSLAKSFREALDFTGVGNHPDFIEGFRVFAKALATGTHVSGKNPSPEGQRAPGSPERPTIAQAMYPNLPSSAGSR